MERGRQMPASFHCCFKLLLRRFRLDGDVLRMSDGVWRAGGLGGAGGRHGEDE
jgi:hypothetical protein